MTCQYPHHDQIIFTLLSLYEARGSAEGCENHEDHGYCNTEVDTGRKYWMGWQNGTEDDQLLKFKLWRDRFCGITRLLAIAGLVYDDDEPYKWTEPIKRPTQDHSNDILTVFKSTTIITTNNVFME